MYRPAGRLTQRRASLELRSCCPLCSRFCAVAMPYQVANLNVSTPSRGREAERQRGLWDAEEPQEMRPLAESCFTNHTLTELIILRVIGFRGLQPCRFSTLCRSVLSASQRPFSVAERLEGKAWRAVTHHATRFSTKGAASSSAASEDAGCAKYECPHVWIGSALAPSNPTLTAPSIPHFSRGLQVTRSRWRSRRG